MHALIDDLPEEEVVELHEIAMARRAGGEGHVSDPLHGISQGERERFHSELREAEGQFARGEGLPVEEAIRRLRRA